MARVKFPFFSESASGTLINNRTSPPRGRKRRAFSRHRGPKRARNIHTGRMAGAIVFHKNGLVTAIR